MILSYILRKEKSKSKRVYSTNFCTVHCEREVPNIGAGLAISIISGCGLRVRMVAHARPWLTDSYGKTGTVGISFNTSILILTMFRKT